MKKFLLLCILVISSQAFAGKEVAFRDYPFFIKHALVKKALITSSIYFKAIERIEGNILEYGHYDVDDVYNQQLSNIELSDMKLDMIFGEAKELLAGVMDASLFSKAREQQYFFEIVKEKVQIRALSALLFKADDSEDFGTKIEAAISDSHLTVLEDQYTANISFTSFASIRGNLNCKVEFHFQGNASINQASAIEICE